MLTFEPCENNGGFIFWGDYSSLDEVHKFLMDLSENSTQLDSEGLIPSLAYDLRKAYEGQRESKRETIWEDEITIYGVEQVWPTFIAILALCRGSLAYFPSSRLDQSIIYRLEALFVEAVTSAMPKVSENVIKAYEVVSVESESSISELIDSRVPYFLCLTKSEREIQLHQIINSMCKLTVELCKKFKKPICGNRLPEELEQYSWESVPDNIEL